MPEQTFTSSTRHGEIVHVTAFYPTAAREKSFPTDLHQTLQQVVSEAYLKLEEQPRPGDVVTCHGSDTNLSAYLGLTLAQMLEQGICITAHEHQYVFQLDIDAEAGGA